jgi:hypothetical protein
MSKAFLINKVLQKILLFLTLLTGGSAMAIEEPKYNIIQSDGDFEIRHYMPMLIALTEADGDMDEASSKGFRVIADFIFGNNLDPTHQQKTKIAMTAPVTVVPESVKIEMTAPVSLTPKSSEVDIRTSAKWRIHFVMPAQYTMTSIPKPKNTAVTLEEVPSKYFVVFKYSGFNTVSKVQDNVLKAQQWAKERSLIMIGAPMLARYDPPWTLPMFRRNEIMIEISNP